MASSLDKTVDVKHYVRMLWRRRGVVLVATISVLASALIGLSMVRRQYESQVTLMIEDRSPLAGDVEQVMGGSRSGAGGKGYGFEEERLSKLIGRVRSRPFLERVIRILRMQDDPALLAAAEVQRKKHPEVSREEIAIRMLVQGLQSRIQFQSRGPGLYQITVGDFSPQNAQVLAQWISELFVDITIQNELEKIRSARDFGAEQLKLYEEQLRRSEAALEQYKGTMIQQSLAANTVQAGNLNLADALLQRVRQEADAAQARVKPFAREASRAGLDPSDPTVWSDAETQDLVRRVGAALQSGVVERLAVTGPGETQPWPPQGTYDLLRRDLLQRLEQRAAGLHPEAAADAKDALARHAFARLDAEIQLGVQRVLDQAIEVYRHQARSQPVDEMQSSRLVAEVQKDRMLLESFRSQMVASDVRQAVETTKLGLRVEILDPAQVPLKASRPDRNKILLAALLVGPLLGAGLAFLAEATDPTLRSLEDFRRTFEEPILCTTPLLSNRVASTRGLRRHWVPATVVLILLLTGGFFMARKTLLRGLDAFADPMHIVNPKDAGKP